MRITLVGSRHFGVTTLQMLSQHEVDVIRVVVADADDRLAATAGDAGIEVVVAVGADDALQAERTSPLPHTTAASARHLSRFSA